MPISIIHIPRFALLILFAASMCSCEMARQERIERAIRSGAAFLSGIQRPDGAIADTINPLFDTWETVIAAQALMDCAEPTGTHSPFGLAFSFLEAHENEAGLICHNRKCRAATCLETSSAYLQLRKAYTGHSPLMLAEILARLDTVAKLQLPDGSWEIGNPDVLEQKAFPSVTAFCLLMPASTRSPLRTDAALDWLLQKQNPEGHWGQSWEYYGSPAYALWPVMRALRTSNLPACAAARARALAWMCKSQLTDGGWDFPIAGAPKQVSRSLHSAMMLAAMQGETGPQAEAAIQNGVDFLLGSQSEDGSWDGGCFPIANARYEKREYVFATAMALQVLAAARELQPR